jgi:predicted ArsR family transcriptional regulator
MGPRTESQLNERSPTDRKTTSRYLNDLRNLEVVSFKKGASTGKRGPRPRVFELTEPALLRFCDAADTFALALSEAQARSLREHIEELPKAGGG